VVVQLPVGHQRVAARGDAVDDVVEPDALAGAERVRIPERGAHLRVAGQDVHVVRLEPDDQAEFAQCPVVRMRVEQDLVGEDVVR
jgi:hypothetical protein